jgi:hypothetical protein
LVSVSDYARSLDDGRIHQWRWCRQPIDMAYPEQISASHLDDLASLVLFRLAVTKSKTSAVASPRGGQRRQTEYQGAFPSCPWRECIRSPTLLLRYPAAVNQTFKASPRRLSALSLEDRESDAAVSCGGLRMKLIETESVGLGTSGVKVQLSPSASQATFRPHLPWNPAHFIRLLAS